MHSATRLFVMAAVLTLAATGCQSRQSKIDTFQKEYDQAEAQFRKDCNEEFLKVPPTLSPKCADEDKAAKEAWSKLQSERTRQ